MSTPHLSGKTGSISLGAILGRGGEGTVYDVSGKANLVAKVYHQAQPRTKAEKLDAMLAMASAYPKITAVAAWPTDVLRTDDGVVRGLLMPKINGYKDIHTLYGPKSRLNEFPEADWRHLIHAAANTARAFAVLHNAGCVIGDVNHGGIRVAPDATVRLIDCDSFQISAAGKQYLCEVGVEDFTPSELQGKAFKNVVRTSNHDNFGLAVIVFHLLMMGRHPFVGRFLGPGDLTIERSITEFRYAYAKDAGRLLMQPPPHSPLPTAASAKIGDLWERAFSPVGAQPNSRPTAVEWADALEALAHQVAQCRVNPGHYYHRELGACPWCAIESSAGILLFALPLGAIPRDIGGPFNMQVVWARIVAVPSLGPIPEPTIPTNLSASPEAVGIGRERHRRFVFGHIANVAIVVVLIAIASAATVLWIVVGIVGFTLVAKWVDKAGLHAPFVSQRQQAEAEFESLRRRWAQETGSEQLSGKMRELETVKQEWAGLPARREAEYQGLLKERKANELKRFLDRQMIYSARIKGIGPGRRAALSSYGIETAGDITPAALARVPGIGDVLFSELLGWRRHKESEFSFNPNGALNAQDVAAMDRAITARKLELEKRLTQGSAELTQIRATIEAKRRNYRSAVEKAAHQCAQAKADAGAIR